MAKMYFCIGLLLSIVFAVRPAQAVEAIELPHFRHIDRSASMPTSANPSALVLLADEDFAPFSFKTADGKLAGISVQLALAACSELKIQCQIKALPYADLVAGLIQKQGNLIIGGPQMTVASGSQVQATRPYFYSSSSFMARTGTNLGSVETKNLAGRRLGFVTGSSQSSFLKKYFDRSNLISFETEPLLFEALRTGGLDVAFADSLHEGFWLKSASSRDCCSIFGTAFLDRSTFTHGLVMLTAAQDSDLRESFDIALDRLQEKGITAKILATYLPSNPF